MGSEESGNAPQDIDIEKSVIASCLLKEDCIDEVLESLDNSVFYRTSHKYYMDAVRQLRSINASIDLVSVSSYLRDKGLEKSASPGELHP